MNFEALAQARWISLTCDCRQLGDDLMVVASPQERVVVGELAKTGTTHVYDLTDQELDENRLRCPKCGSAELRIC